jgi:hypothetical protein
VIIPERPEPFYPRQFVRAASIKVIVLLAVFFTSLASAEVPPEQKHTEKPYALIYGTVYGPDDRPVYGVRVLIRRADQKKPKWELRSDHAGEFAQRVPAGHADYLVRADIKDIKLLNGKKLTEVPEVTVKIENDERANVSLHLK